MLEKKPVSTQSFFPVLMALAVLTTALTFNYVISAVGTPGEKTTVLGAATVKETYFGTLVVKTESEIRTYKNVTYPSGASIYDFLVEAASKSSFSFVSDKYDFGRFVHTVNGRRSLNDEYWKLAVNGEEPVVSMEEYVLKDGDEVEFELVRF